MKVKGEIEIDSETREMRIALEHEGVAVAFGMPIDNCTEISKSFDELMDKVLEKQLLQKKGMVKCPYCGEIVEPVPSGAEYYHGGAIRVVTSEKCPVCGNPL